MKFKAAFLAATAATSMATPAAAQWIHNEDGSAFDDTETHIALVAVGAYGFGFRCTNVSDLTAVMIAPEKMDKETEGSVNALIPQLLVRVDDGQVISIYAEIKADDESISILSVANPDQGGNAKLASQVRDGKSRVSVAVKMVDEIFHETKFSLVNSTAAIGKLMTGCGIAE